MIRLSYVVVTDGWQPVAELAAALATQTAADELELVLVSRQPFEPPRVAIPVRTVVGPGGRTDRAEGVGAAAGNVVALGETHVVPSPGWARAVLAAHDAGADVVLPWMQNANPWTPLSWAGFLMDYGRYAGSTCSRTAIPTYNATVRRSALLELPSLDEALVPGLALDAALRTRGAIVAQAPEAVLAHVNVDRPLDWTRERVLAGLLLARTRSTFGRARRVAYALAAPLIAAVLFRRALRAPRDGAPRATLVLLALGCVLYALGEATGYLRPSASARTERRMLEYEMHKRTYARGAA